MASPVTRGNISNLLQYTLYGLILNLQTKPREWTYVYDTYRTRKAFELIEEMRTMDVARIKPEGSQIQFSDMGQVRQIQFTPQTYATGVTLSYEMISDNLYQSQFPQLAKQMQVSIGVVEDTVGADVFNNGWNPATPGPDGLPIFSTAHPIDTGTYANTLATPADLNETSLSDLSILAQTMRNARGIFMNAKIEMLYPSIFNQYLAEKVTESKYSPFTGNNDINSAYTANGMVPKGYHPLTYFSFENGFLCKTNVEGALRYFLRENTRYSYQESAEFGSVSTFAQKRFTFGVADARGVVGSQGT